MLGATAIQVTLSLCYRPLTVDETVMLAGLVRGLVRTCYDQVCEQAFYGGICPEVLAAAQWKASRWGLEADLADIDIAEVVPARQLIEKLLVFVHPALEDFGEWEEVTALIQNVLHQGNGATRQRRIFAQQESLQDVVDYLIEETGKGCLRKAFSKSLTSL